MKLALFKLDKEYSRNRGNFVSGSVGMQFFTFVSSEDAGFYFDVLDDFGKLWKNRNDAWCNFKEYL